MVESLIYDIKEIISTNRDMKTYIDSVKKKHAAYLAQNTLHY